MKIAPYYYYPGWWEGSANGHLFINTAKWAELPKPYQQMVTVAAGQVSDEQVLATLYGADEGAEK